jgi:hypothetical protein
MTVTAPHKGTLTPNKRKAAKKTAPKAAAGGSYRPDVGFAKTDGIKVTLRAEKGITTKKYLTVPFRFQAPPINELERPLSAPWPTFETLSDGQRSRPEGAALEVWTLETLFYWDYEQWMVWTGTADTNPNAVNGVFEPQLFIKELKEIAKANAIFRFVMEDPTVWGSQPLVNALATLTGVAPKQKPGEVGTEYLTLTVQEFKEIELLQQKRSRKSDNDRERKYQVKTTDTLVEIARHEMGRPSAWREIAKANGITGVHSNDAAALQQWLKTHHKTEIIIPAIPRHAQRPTVRSTSSPKARGT